MGCGPGGGGDMTDSKGSSIPSKEHIHVTAGELDEYFSGEMLDGETVSLAQSMEECSGCSQKAARVLIALNELDRVLVRGRGPIPASVLVAAAAVSVADPIRIGLQKLLTTAPSIAARLG